MTEAIGTITGPIKFGCDPQGKRAGVTLRFNVLLASDEGESKARVHLDYKEYYQAILTAGVSNIEHLEGHSCIVTIDEKGKVRFSRMYEG